MIIAKGAARRLGFGRSSSAYPVRAACSADAAEAIAALSLFATWLSQLEILNGRRAHSRRAWRIRDGGACFHLPICPSNVPSYTSTSCREPRNVSLLRSAV